MKARRVPYEAHTSVVGYASEGSACLHGAASAKAGRAKHLEEPRPSAHGAPQGYFVRNVSTPSF